MDCTTCGPTPTPRKDRPHTFLLHEMSRCPTCRTAGSTIVLDGGV